MTTTKSEFDQSLNGRRVVPVSRTLFADGETPVALFRKLARKTPGSFLLESAEQGGIFSRYSFIGVRSFGVLTQVGQHSRWLDYGMSQARAFGDHAFVSPLADLEALHARWSGPGADGFPPLTGGLVGFIGWEVVRELEHLPNAPVDTINAPGQAWCFVSDMVAIDHRTGHVHLIANVLNDRDAEVDALWFDAQSRLDSLEQHLREQSDPVVSAGYEIAAPQAISATSSAAYEEMVERSKQFIIDGDVFQVVLSKRFDAQCSAEPIDVYRVLRSLNPSPYMYILQLESAFGSYAVVGSSPEALVKVEQGRAYTHPIAGSRPRGATPDVDLALESELLADPKERAEHLMLVDLARNDLARVCDAGSVEVTEFMRVERFSHIMHIVSSVEGNVRDGLSPVDVFAATFPAGTLSGAPKPRALEIIDELETEQRGIYGGVVGYFDFSGNADLAICIRTAYIADGIARVQAGAGLVADSVPATEDLEAHTKAAAVLRAIETANRLHF